MSEVPDDTKLSRLSIPGTHSSMTGYSKFCRDAPYFQCLTQQMSLEDQLRAGIRFIDMQLQQIRSHPDQLLIHHGSMNLAVSLVTVFNRIREFLTLFPSETIIVNLREAQRGAIGKWNELKKKINSYMMVYPSFFYQENFSNSRYHTTTLKVARGKIVLLNSFSDFDTITTGKSVNLWLGSRAFTMGHFNQMTMTYDDENTVTDFDPGLMITDNSSIHCDNNEVNHYILELENNIIKAGAVDNNDQFYMTWVNYVPQNKLHVLDECRKLVDLEFQKMLYRNWVNKHLHGTGIIIMNFLDDQDKIDAYIANIIRFNVKKGKS